MEELYRFPKALPYILMKLTHFSFFISCLIGLGLGFFHQTAHAQAPDSLIQEYETDPIVMTGTRIEQSLGGLPNSIQVITREQIARYPTNNVLPLVAREVPGLFLNRRGIVGFGVGPNSGGSISIRGLSGTPNTQVLILVNGQPQFMGIFGSPHSRCLYAFRCRTDRSDSRPSQPHLWNQCPRRGHQYHYPKAHPTGMGRECLSILWFFSNFPSPWYG